MKLIALDCIDMNFNNNVISFTYKKGQLKYGTKQSVELIFGVQSS